MLSSRAFQFACSLAAFAARHILRPAGKLRRRRQLRDLPPELLDDIALPPDMRELLQREEIQQQRGITLFFRR